MSSDNAAAKRNRIKDCLVQPTAGIIIIGDEILKGKVADVNSAYLCEKLTKMGVRIGRISMIGDDVATIAEEVKRFSLNFTYVMTTGGIGPTHDDVTYEAVARAFDRKLVLNEELLEAIKDYFDVEEPSEAEMKMAKIPENAELNFNTDAKTGKKSAVLVSVDNVYVFAGIPAILRFTMDALGPSLFHHPEFLSTSDQVFFDVLEIQLTPKLDEAVKKFPQVTFGSYPVIDNTYYKTCITFESGDSGSVEQAVQFMKAAFPDRIVLYDEKPEKHAWEKLFKLMSRTDKKHLAEPIGKALKVIREAYDRYGPDGVCLFFNGGKDCTAVLHLVHSFLVQQFPGKKLLAVDVVEEERLVFPEVVEFVQQTKARYNLELVTYRGMSIKDGLDLLLKQRPQIKAAFLGMRIGDPHAGTSDSDTFVHTTPGWPPLMRVYPILHFDYHVLWDFIRSLYLPYCALYDKGYTSLGRADTSLPNAALLISKTDGFATYKPAYTLVDPTRERDSRKPPQKPADDTPNP